MKIKARSRANKGSTSRWYWAPSALLLGAAIAIAAPGNLDPTFADGGRLILPLGFFGNAALAIVQQSDGKLVLAGTGSADSAGGSDSNFVLARLTPDGARDNTFDADGATEVDFLGFGDTPHAIIQQSGGQLVVAGDASHFRGGSTRIDAGTDIALARFDADGSLDFGFGAPNGRVILDLGGDRESATAMIEQPGGKIVIAGFTDAGAHYQMVFARFNTDGTLDVSFGSAGIRKIDFGTGTQSKAYALTQQADGKLVAAGSYFATGTSASDFALVRVTADGALDPTFGTNGLLTVDLAGPEDIAKSVVVQPNGAIVATGYVSNSIGTVANAALLRVSSTGVPDNSFGSSGIAVVDLGADSALASTVLQADGKLVATGARGTNVLGADGVSTASMILARFNSNGTLDSSYGTAGVATVDFGHANQAAISSGTALIQQSDGKFVATGPNSLGEFGAARFDDAASFPGVVGFTQAEQAVDETAASITYTVRRTGGTAGMVSVDYATSNGQAEAASDYVETSGSLTWNDGDASDRTITVNLIDDALVEPNEDFSLSLSGPAGGAVLAASEATATILSNDGPGELGFLDGLTPIQTVEGAVVLHTFVRRAGGSTGAVSVNYATAAGAAQAGSDFTAATGTLTWGDGDTADKPISITILDDTEIEAAEDFQIRLSGPTGGATIADLGDIQLVQINDDEPGFQLNGATATVAEGAGLVTLTVSRTGPANGVASVDYATSSGSATDGSDFTGVIGTLTWADGDAADKTITVNITGDATDEADEEFTVALSNPSSGSGLGAVTTATVTITDDDATASDGGGSGGGGALRAIDLALLFFLLCIRSAVTGSKRRFMGA